MEEENIFERLLKDRIVWVGEEVTDELGNRVCAQLLTLASESSDDIYMYINSPGGSITAGMAMYDMMQFIKPDVCTVALGMAASMGQFLLSSGAKNKRYAMPYTRVLMHQPLGGVGGSATDVKIRANLLLDVKRVMAELTAEQTGKTVEQIYTDSDKDNWFSAQEAKEYGLLDNIVYSADSVKTGSISKNTPPIGNLNKA